MSMELRLIFVRNRGSYFGTGDLYVTDELEVEQDYTLYGHIDNKHMCEKGVKQVCKPKPIPPGFKVMVLDEEDGWKERKDAPHAGKLTYVTAEELAKIKPEIWKGDWNKAVLAMLKALPAEFPLILWWH